MSIIRNFTIRFYWCRHMNVHYKNMTRPSISIISAVSRNLYSESSFGLDKFLKRRNRVQSKYADSREAFIERINKYCKNEEGKPHYIYADDIKNLILLCENNERELNLLWQALKMYYESKGPKEDYDFGPELARLFFLLKLPEEGKKMVANEVVGVMRFLSSYIILMNLFYSEGYYQQVINTMYKLINDRVSINLLPKPNLMLTTAACYKLNTENSLKDALYFIKKHESTGNILVWNAFNFVAALALKQKKPHIALELVFKSNSVYATTRNIKAEGLIMLGRATEALSLLRVGEEIHVKKERVVFSSTIASIEKSLKENNNVKELKELENIKEYLRRESLLLDETLDEALCATQQVKPDDPDSKVSERQKHRAMIQASFNKGTTRENIIKHPRNRSNSSY